MGYFVGSFQITVREIITIIKKHFHRERERKRIKQVSMVTLLTISILLFT